MLGWRWSFIELDTESVFFGQYWSDTVPDKKLVGIIVECVSYDRVHMYSSMITMHLLLLYSHTQK